MRHKLITKKRNIWYSPVVTVLLVAAIGWSGVVAARATIKQREVMALRDDASRELVELKNENSDLTNKIRILSTDDGIDQEIKSQYRVVRPEEQVAIIVPKDNQSVSTEKPSLTWWEKLRRFVGL